MLRLLVELERKVETEDKSSLVPSNSPGRVSSKRRPDGSNATTELTKKATARTLKFTAESESESASVNLSLSDRAIALPRDFGILRFLLENADISSVARTSRTWNRFSGNVSPEDPSAGKERNHPHIEAAARGDLDYILFLQRRHLRGFYKPAVFADPQLLNQAAAHGRLHVVQYLRENLRADSYYDPRVDVLACGVAGKAECFLYIRANWHRSPLEDCARQAISAGNIECYRAIIDLAREPHQLSADRKKVPWPDLLPLAVERGRVEFVSKFFRSQYAKWFYGSPRYYEKLMHTCSPNVAILKILDDAALRLDSKVKAPIQYDAMIRLLNHSGETARKRRQAFECFLYLYEQIEHDLDAQRIALLVDRAIEEDNPLVLKYLLDRGAEVDVDKAVDTIALAAVKPTSEMLAMLHEHGVPWPTRRARSDDAILVRAVTEGEKSVDCVRYILESGWCLDEPDVRLLPLALSSGAPLELLEYLFEKGYPFTTVGRQGRKLSNPLFVVIDSIRPEVFFWALSRGCPYFDDDEHRDHYTPTLCEIAARDTRDSDESMRLACDYYIGNGLDIAWGSSLEDNCENLNWQAARFSLLNGCPRPPSVCQLLSNISWDMGDLRTGHNSHRARRKIGIEDLDALRNSTVPPIPWLDDMDGYQSRYAMNMLEIVSDVSNPERADAFSYIIREGCPMAAEVACRAAIKQTWVEGIKCATDAGASRTIEDSNLALMAKSSACFSYMMQDGFPRPDGKTIDKFLRQANVFFLRVAHHFGIVGYVEDHADCIMDAAQDALRKGSIVDDACLTYVLKNGFPLSKRFCDTVAENRSLHHLRNLVQSGSSQNSSMFYY